MANNDGKVKLVSTDKDKHHITGSIFYASPEAAQAIVEKGFATAWTEADEGNESNSGEEKKPSGKKKK